MKNIKSKFQPPCERCGGKCCEYVAIEIGRPTTKTEFDNIRWYLAHRNVNVFIDHKKKWHIEFRSPCENLTKDKKCLMYERRPHICRRHGIREQECEFYDSPHLLYLTSIIDFEDHMRNKGIDWQFKNDHGIK